MRGWPVLITFCVALLGCSQRVQEADAPRELVPPISDAAEDHVVGMQPGAPAPEAVVEEDLPAAPPSELPPANDTP